MRALVREVRYVPFLCRFGWHRWRCPLQVSWLDLFRTVRMRCADVVVHVHGCTRCGRVRIEGRQHDAEV